MCECENDRGKGSVPRSPFQTRRTWTRDWRNPRSLLTRGTHAPPGFVPPVTSTGPVRRTFRTGNPPRASEVVSADRGLWVDDGPRPVLSNTGPCPLTGHPRNGRSRHITYILRRGAPDRSLRSSPQWSGASLFSPQGADPDRRGGSITSTIGGGSPSRRFGPALSLTNLRSECP